MARNKYPETTIERILDVSTQLFLEKGYEKTSIQDIINALGDLSKGAIYHHFKSKEDIIDAVMERMFGNINEFCIEIEADKTLSGLEKIKRLISASIENPNQKVFAKMLPSNFINSPQLLAKQMEATIYELAHKIIEKFIKEGIVDGSIKTDYPRELAEMISLLCNIWLNPRIFIYTQEECYRKCLFFKHLTESINLPIFDDKMIQRITEIAPTLVAKNTLP